MDLRDRTVSGDLRHPTRLPRPSARPSHEESRPPSAERHATSASTRIEPPDTDLLAWGEVFRQEESVARQAVEQALERAITAGDLQPGRGAWRRVATEVCDQTLLAPAGDGAARTVLLAVLDERVDTWVQLAWPRVSGEGGGVPARSWTRLAISVDGRVLPPEPLHSGPRRRLPSSPGLRGRAPRGPPVRRGGGRCEPALQGRPRDARSSSGSDR